MFFHNDGHWTVAMFLFLATFRGNSVKSWWRAWKIYVHPNALLIREYLIVVRFVTRLENKLSRYRRFGATRRGGEQNRKIVEPDDKLTLIAGDSVVGGPLQSD